MSSRNIRMLASTGLILTPLVYTLGIKLWHNDYLFLSRITIFGWIFISLAMGVSAATTFRNQIFGLNPGSLLGYSVPIITLALALHASEYPAGAYIMYGLFAISFAYGSITLIKYLRQ